jgi:hypothetical protein
MVPAVPPEQETGTAGSPVPGVSLLPKTYMQRPCPKETRAIILNSFRECAITRSQKTKQLSKLETTENLLTRSCSES